MEIELAEHPTRPEKRRSRTIQQVFAKDEAVLARFGKRQQLRVSAPTPCAKVAVSLAWECP